VALIFFLFQTSKKEIKNNEYALTHHSSGHWISPLI
jgi:hypothetical protein